MNPRATHWRTLRRKAYIEKERHFGTHDACGEQNIYTKILCVVLLNGSGDNGVAVLWSLLFIFVCSPESPAPYFEKRAAARSHKPTTLLLSPNHSRTSDETTVRPNLFIFPTTPFDSMCVYYSESDLQKWKPVYVLAIYIIRLVADHSGLLVFILTLYDKLCVLY
jgi:hypothetical protein